MRLVKARLSKNMDGLSLCGLKLAFLRKPSCILFIPRTRPEIKVCILISFILSLRLCNYTEKMCWSKSVLGKWFIVSLPKYIKYKALATLTGWTYFREAFSMSVKCDGICWIALPWILWKINLPYHQSGF